MFVVHCGSGAILGSLPRVRNWAKSGRFTSTSKKPNQFREVSKDPSYEERGFVVSATGQKVLAEVKTRRREDGHLPSFLKQFSVDKTTWKGSKRSGTTTSKKLSVENQYGTETVYCHTVVKTTIDKKKHNYIEQKLEEITETYPFPDTKNRMCYEPHVLRKTLIKHYVTYLEIIKIFTQKTVFINNKSRKKS